MNNQQEDFNQEITRKRKSTTTATTNNSSKRINNNNNNNNQNINLDHYDQEDNDLLALSLSVRPASRPRRAIPDEETSPSPLPLQLSQPCSMQTRLVSQSPPQLPLQISPSHSHSLCIPPFMPDPSVVPVYRQEIPSPAPAAAAPPSRPLRPRRNPTQAPGQGKGDTVPALYPWATTHRATVHNLNYLLSKQITTITGEMQCKKCEKQYEMGYDLRDKFYEVGRFIAENKSSMHDRAPSVWMNPVLPTCKFCDQENSAKPVIPDKKKQINWLFLLLGQLLGCCTLDQLKYFCKHTKNHRTGAKDRVLYLTYLGLCKQLDPNGPFGR
ncbi:hypothetical protein CICLE_v10030108mg [Citrus x clementina]|uniref:F13F21.24 protein n=4 Tax=Citrus TaxID=2706 RepID=A0ACB8IGK9_CITSI|nr:hypothetical protein CICLE_v10030108mg [Citrus x clementina]KAH9696031.1 F13F21.24 protein [Citrus sinensis]